MASISATFVIIFSTISNSMSTTLSATLVDDLNNLHPPPDFNTTLTNNCLHNPSLRYCNTTFDVHEIFKSTIVASHLCKESNNPNCIESFPKIDLHNRPKLAPLYISLSFFWKYCPLTILTIDLSNNSLKGIFPSDIFHCSQIQVLDLSHNELSGDVSIEDFSLFSNLTSLNLSYNHFAESKISDSQFFKKFNSSSSFVHSGLIPDHKKFRIKALLLLLGFPILIILIVVSLCWLCFWRPDFLPRVLQTKHKFTPSILKSATNGFSKKNLVSTKRGVDMYRGLLRDGTEVRIEMYWDKVSREKRRKFVKECKVFVELQHRNIVRVLGWCDNRRLRAIVSEWVDGINMEMWLSMHVPPWKHRVRVLMRVVEVLMYLDEEWPEVGCDLKTSSILLAEGREPLISRFKVEDDQNSSAKNIYNFGVFVLEMITNKRPLEEFEEGEAGFNEYVRMYYPVNLGKVVDEGMKKTGHVIDQAAESLELGLKCMDLSSGRQPSFEEIYDILSRIYSNCIASASPSVRRLHGHRGGGHHRMKSR